MKQWVGYVLLALCLVFAYQGWGNVRNTPETENRARDAACEGKPAEECFLPQKQVVAFKADVLKRRYQFESNKGPVTVTCARAAWFFGAWQCTAAAGTL